MANEFIARNGITSLGNIIVSGSITSTGAINMSGSIASASFATTAVTASSADNFLVRNTLTAQTLVVQTITSSVDFVTGSTRFGSIAANTHQFTGSILVTGSITSHGGFVLGNSSTISPTGSIGYNNAVGVFIYGKSGSEADFRLYNSAGLTAMSVVAGTQNVLFNGNIQSKVVDIAAGSSAAFSFGIDHQSTFAFGSTNGRRVAILRNASVDDNGLQFGYDTTDKTGIIAGAATLNGAGIDFYTYNGSSWGNRMRITSTGSIGIGNFGGFNPLSDLELRNNNATLYDQTSDNGQDGTGVTLTIRNNDISTTGSFSQVNMQVSGDSGRALGRIVTIRMASATSDMAFVTENANTKAEKMRITAAGNIGIGTTNPLTKVHILGSTGVDLIRFDAGVNTKFLFNLTGAADDPFTLKRTHPSGGDLNIMTWAYSGRVGIGTTTPSYRLHTSYDGCGDYVAQFHNVNSGDCGGSGVLILQGGTFNSSGDTSSRYISFRRGDGTEIGAVRRNGASNVAFDSSSDYRLKEDLKEFNGLEKISAIKVYDFKWKNTTERMNGVLAHELQEIIPYAVGGEKDGVDGNGEMIIQGVDYSKLVPILIKSIQELKTQNDTLASRITELENK